MSVLDQVIAGEMIHNKSVFLSVMKELGLEISTLKVEAQRILESSESTRGEARKAIQRSLQLCEASTTLDANSDEMRLGKKCSEFFDLNIRHAIIQLVNGPICGLCKRFQFPDFDQLSLAYVNVDQSMDDGIEGTHRES